jgi:hypothetical protein
MTAWKHIEQVAYLFGYAPKQNSRFSIYQKTVLAGDLLNESIVDNESVFANTPIECEIECVHGRMLLRRFITDTQDLQTFDVNTTVGDAKLQATAGK